MTVRRRSRRTAANAVPKRGIGWAHAVVVVCALAAAGCGGSPSGDAAAGPVSPPPVTLEGCTYVYNSSIPSGEPMGVQPGFAPFRPDASADSALQQIKVHGGSAMVDSLIVPPGISLYAGPDASQPPIATVGEGDSILVAEPVVYTDRSGGTWLAFFLSCGGEHLYWMGVDHVPHEDAGFATGVQSQIRQDRQAAPYTRTGQASLLPIVINDQHHLVFADPTVKLEVGRGEVYRGV